MKKSVYFLSFVLLVSCSQSSESADKDVTSSIVANGENDAQLKKELAEIDKEEKARLAEEKAKMTSMEFDKMSHNYGKIKADTDNETVFWVTNTGKKPLEIESVSASCGCTMPLKPENPIMPGKKDKIEVVFHPKSSQVGPQNKTITVVANTDPKMVVLTISAEVEENKK